MERGKTSLYAPEARSDASLSFAAESGGLSTKAQSFCLIIGVSGTRRL